MPLAVIGVIDNLLLGEGLVGVLVEVPLVEFAVLRPDAARLAPAIADSKPDVVIVDAGFAPAARARSLALAREIGATGEIGVILLAIEPDLDVAGALIAQGPNRRGYLLYDGQLGRAELLAAISARWPRAARLSTSGSSPPLVNGTRWLSPPRFRR